MTLCPISKGHCCCQPDEGVFCPESPLMAKYQEGQREQIRLAIAEEREACARVCEAEAGPGVDAWDCAAAIRRGERHE